MAGIRHIQVTLGLPEPRAYSSLPSLRLVQAGIQRSYSQQMPAPTRVRLPITPAVLLAMRAVWHPKADNPDIVMLWAASVLCFFGFFRAMQQYVCFCNGVFLQMFPPGRDVEGRYGFQPGICGRPPQTGYSTSGSPSPWEH